MRKIHLLVLGMIALCPLAVSAQSRLPILDVAALPRIDDAGRAGYRDNFILGATPRAFAIAPDGKYGARWGARTLDDARQAALKSCADKGGKDCTIYAEDLDVVWPGRPASVRLAAPDNLLTVEHAEFAPDKRFFWFGPQAARGIVVFGHGYEEGVDARPSQPPGWTRAFNNIGFDVVRFARDPMWDRKRDEVGEWLRTGLAELRKRGWKMVIVAGQSRGAYNALQVLDTPGLADVVIAGSAAAYGQGPGNNRTLTDLWTMFGAAAAPKTRVVIIQFNGDPYIPDPGGRVGLINDRLKPKVGPLLMIDRPDGYSGHGSQYNAKFAPQFAGCLLRFATDPSPPSTC